MDSAPCPSFCVPDTVTASLRMILHGLRAVLEACGLDAALGIVLYRRIGTTLGRIERMLVRFRAGRLWTLPQRGAAARRTGCGASGARVPRRFGWLVQAGGYQAAGFGSQLQALLNEPDMAGLLAASPQARRVLRPLCRALAVGLPGSLAKSPSAKSVSVRQRRTRVLPEPSRIRLPRGVMTAARRQGFGKDR